MAKLYSCDRCRGQVESTEEDRREWTAVVLSKIEGSAFQAADLCKSCTAGLRRFLANEKA